MSLTVRRFFRTPKGLLILVLAVLTGLAATRAGFAHVAELYRAPDLHAALYCAFFMITDPPSSPPRERDQLADGVVTGAASFAAFIWIGAAYWLLAGCSWQTPGMRRGCPGPADSSPTGRVALKAAST